MRLSSALLAFALTSLSALSVSAGEPTTAAATAPTTAVANWQTGEGVSLAGVLFPHVHMHSVYGGTSAAELPEIGHHDPVRDGWTIQGIEAGLSGRFSRHVEAFGTVHLAYDRETEEWDHEFEEWFAKLKELPGGLELRGGRYLNRFGFHNSTHQHGWDYVTMPLANGRFLGDDGLYTIGGEVDWKLPVRWPSHLSVSVGTTPEAEAHAHEEEEGRVEPLYEAEGARFDGTLVVANWTNQMDFDDFHQLRAGLSGAWGENTWGRHSQVYGAHVEYLWRENGYEPGGRSFRWRTEAMLRHLGAVSGHLPGEEEEEEGEEEEEPVRRASLEEFGLHTALTYGWASGLEAGVRGEYVGGIAEAGLEERWRVSPVVTYYFNAQRTFYLRGQYDYDRGEDIGEEHSVWLQMGFNWGGAEVR